MDPVTYAVQGPDEKFTTVRTCGGPIQAARMCYPGLLSVAPISWVAEGNRTIVATPKDTFIIRKTL